MVDYKYVPISEHFLSEKYEFRLLREIIGKRKSNGDNHYRDFRFGESIIEILDKEFFSSEYTQMIVDTMVSFYREYKKVPYYDEILIEIKTNKKINEVEEKQVKEILSNIRGIKNDNPKWVQEKTTLFFQQQQILKTAYSLIDKIKHEKGFDDVNLAIKELKDLSARINVKNNFQLLEPGDHSYLEDDRYPVELGWGKDFDKAVNLRQGTTLVTIAPTGTGKTTSAAVTAVHNFLQGEKVLLIFFEDDYHAIKTKIMAKMLGVGINNLSKNKDFAKIEGDKLILEGQEKGGQLVLIKMSMTTTTTNSIRNAIDKVTAKVGDLHLVILDYLDCVKSPYDKYYRSKYEAEADVVEDLIEMMGSNEYYLPCLTYVQSGRHAVNSSSVTEEDAGGAFDKIKRARTVLSFAKTLDDKQNKTAIVTILKNSNGDAGIEYKNVEFDNSKVHIHISNDHCNVVTKFINKK